VHIAAAELYSLEWLLKWGLSYSWRKEGGRLGSLGAILAPFPQQKVGPSCGNRRRWQWGQRVSLGTSLCPRERSEAASFDSFLVVAGAGAVCALLAEAAGEPSEPGFSEVVLHLGLPRRRALAAKPFSLTGAPSAGCAQVCSQGGLLAWPLAQGKRTSKGGRGRWVVVVVVVAVGGWWWWWLKREAASHDTAPSC